MVARRRIARHEGRRPVRPLPRIVSVSGPSGVGKTRLLLRLIPVLVARGLRVAAIKHTRHPHPLDVPGKDTERYRRAGAAAAAIAGPAGTAWFGPPVHDPLALVRVLPPVDLVLAEGFRSAPLPRIEVRRRSVSLRFLCGRDPRVFLLVGDGPPPRPLPVVSPDEVERVADLLCARVGLDAHPRLPRHPRMRSVPAGRSKRTLHRVQGSLPRRVGEGRPRRARSFASGRSKMPKTTSRRTGRSTKRSRSDAGRKGGRATLRARGPEFFSEIGRKGGKSRSRNAAAASRGRATKRSGSSAKPRSRGRGRGRSR
jgi:molybdopterin-guanine dinucleotide biosynthesis adapter protein